MGEKLEEEYNTNLQSASLKPSLHHSARSTNIKTTTQLWISRQSIITVFFFCFNASYLISESQRKCFSVSVRILTLISVRQSESSSTPLCPSHSSRRFMTHSCRSFTHFLPSPPSVSHPRFIYLPTLSIGPSFHSYLWLTNLLSISTGSRKRTKRWQSSSDSSSCHWTNWPESHRVSGPDSLTRLLIFNWSSQTRFIKQDGHRSLEILSNQIAKGLGFYLQIFL